MELAGPSRSEGPGKALNKVEAQEWKARQVSLARAYEIVARMHNALEITVSLTESATLYHGRPYLVVGDGRYIEELMKALTSEEVKNIKSLLGSVNQFVDSNDQLNSLVLCKKLKNLYN